MRIPSGKTDQLIFFVAVDSTDLKTRKTGLSAFTVYRSRNGGTATVYTTPTIAELSSSNMPGVYALTVDEDTTIASTSDSEEYCMHVTCATMAPVTRTIELYRRDTTTGNQLLVDANGRVDVIKVAGTTQTAKDIGGAVPAVAAGASGGLLISGSNSGTTTLGALTVTGSMTISDGLLISRSSSNTSAITATGNGTGSGIVATSGSGATGDGIQATSVATNGNGLALQGKGTGAGEITTGGLTGNGAKYVGGGTSGDAILTSTTSGHGATFAGTGTTKHGINATGGATTSAGIAATGGGTSGDGILISATSGHGINTAGGGTTKHGILSTGGTTTSAGLALVGGGTSGDGLKITTTSGHGVNIAATGTSMHGITSTGGSGGTSDGIKAVAGTGGVDIRGNITGNLVGTVSTVTTVTGLTASNLDATISSRMATYTQPTGFLAATFPSGTVANTTNITAGTITTTTNLTTNNDKTGYTLSSAGIQAIWDALTSALTTVGSVGKLLVDNVNATISSRLASAGYTAPDNTSITAIKTQTDKLTFTVANQIDANIQYVNDVQVNGVGTSGSPWGP